MIIAEVGQLSFHFPKVSTIFRPSLAVQLVQKPRWVSNSKQSTVWPKHNALDALPVLMVIDGLGMGRGQCGAAP